LLFKNILLYLCKQNNKIIIMKNPFNSNIDPNLKITDETTEDVLFTIISNISDFQSTNVMPLDSQLQLSNLKEYISSYRSMVKNKIRQENRDRLIRNQ
jgi:hypothetical protein